MIAINLIKNIQTNNVRDKVEKKKQNKNLKESKQREKTDREKQ